MPVRTVNLVAPLAHKATDMHTTDTAASARARSGAASALSHRGGGRNSANGTPPTPGIATSTTATRTTTTRATKARLLPSADPHLFQRLVQAYLECRRTKRTSASAQAFEAMAEHNLYQLFEELASDAWQPGPSVCFVITHPKPREVWAARFRDRIVHHLLYNHIAPRFHARFVADSCACIPGRGTLYAAQRLEHQVRSITRNWSQPAHYMKCDLANFFVSIDKTVLLEQLQRQVAEPWWMSLAETILMHDPRQDVEVRGSRAELALVPPHKSLFNAPADHGLPIGNLSSQFFANVLLDDLDQFIKHRLRAPHYVRYVDDFILLHQSPQWLNQARVQIEQQLASLHLQLNPRKTILQPVARGIDFVGHLLKPHHRITRRRTVRMAMARLQDMPREDLHASANSTFGLLRQATHSHQDRALLGQLMRRRGLVIAGDMTKVFQPKGNP
ncbi:MAG TPA: reverse transcriptase [Curvibacter sp.]|nr:reverse transcriptase [Curvibacter sp.]